ncbi:hypothetical protein MRX96_016148 [Rhipicephalus microplus]
MAPRESSGIRQSALSSKQAANRSSMARLRNSTVDRSRQSTQEDVKYATGERQSVLQALASVRHFPRRDSAGLGHASVFWCAWFHGYYNENKLHRKELILKKALFAGLFLAALAVVVLMLVVLSQWFPRHVTEETTTAAHVPAVRD